MHLDALRASRQLTRSAAAEIVAIALFLALMLTLILSDADLWLIIAANGSIPFFSGTICLVIVRRLRLPYRFRRAEVTRERIRSLLPTAGYLLVIESATALIYGVVRPIVGLFKSAATVGLLEGPIRAHNLFYAYYGALGVTALPTVSAYAAESDRRRLRELVLRGSRYTLALVVPVCVGLMCLSDLVLEAWLGEGFDEGGTAMALMLSYWLLYGSLGVHQMLLVGLGRAREVARIMALVATSACWCSRSRSRRRSAWRGRPSPSRRRTSQPSRCSRRSSCARPGSALASWRAAPGYRPTRSVPCWRSGSWRCATRVALDSPGAVVAALAGGIAAYWLAWWLLVPDRAERATLRGFLRP